MYGNCPQIVAIYGCSIWVRFTSGLTIPEACPVTCHTGQTSSASQARAGPAKGALVPEKELVGTPVGTPLSVKEAEPQQNKLDQAININGTEWR